jgi:hypothetical protein
MRAGTGTLLGLILSVSVGAAADARTTLPKLYEIQSSQSGAAEARIASKCGRGEPKMLSITPSSAAPYRTRTNGRVTLSTRTGRDWVYSIRIRPDSGAFVCGARAYTVSGSKNFFIERVLRHSGTIYRERSRNSRANARYKIDQLFVYIGPS